MKKNKKVIMIIIAIIILIIGIITSIILLNNKKEEPKETIILKENLEVEINSEVNLLSFISEDNKTKIISEDETIDTSKLGEQEITIKYIDRNKEEEYTFKIKVVDTEVPTIEYEKEISITEGTEVDLLKDVKVSDNSKEEIKATIEGEYDINKVGTYNLKYIAEDSSKNKKEEEFTLIVNEKPKETPKTNTTNKKTTSSNTSNNSNNNSNSNNAKTPTYTPQGNPNEFSKWLPLYSVTDENNFENNVAVTVWKITYTGYFSKVVYGLDGEVESYEIDFTTKPGQGMSTVPHVKQYLKIPSDAELRRLAKADAEFNAGTLYVVTGN